MYTPTITLLDKNNPKDMNALFTKKNQVTGRIFPDNSVLLDTPTPITAFPRAYAEKYRIILL